MDDPVMSARSRPLPLRILHIEDSAADARQVTAALAAEGESGIEMVRAETLGEGLRLLDCRGFDLLLLDTELPDAAGLDVLERVARHGCKLPIVVLSDSVDGACNCDALANGALEYISKAELASRGVLRRTLCLAFERHRLIHGLDQRAQELAGELLESELRFRRLVESSRDGLLVIEQDGHVLFANQSAVALLGEPLDGRRWEIGASVDLPAELAVAQPDGPPRLIELVAGETLWGGRQARLVALRDVTERRSLEQQLNQAQKMEAVGRLAGGVAHDFNNLLCAIMGYTQLCLREPGLPDSLKTDLDEIDQAAQRAARLTRQLLAFSRRQAIEPRVLDLGRTLEEIERMLLRLIGEDIEVRLHCEPGLGPVRVDPGQIEQVILNLAVNARDAMPLGGRLEFQLTEQQVEAPRPLAATGAVLPPGCYVRLRTADTGHGIPAAILSQIFDPFFTTKEQDKGTGLGLSTAFGIIQQHGGFVDVQSAEGRGTTFDVYLPRVEEQAEIAARAVVVPGRGGGETILLVEDEGALRALAGRALAAGGYTVLDAPSGAEALARVEQHAGPLHLLLTDVVMPGMSGPELFQKLRERHPALPVLFVSGYSGDAIALHGTLIDGLPLLEKPFTPDALTARVRDVLDRV